MRQLYLLTPTYFAVIAAHPPKNGIVVSRLQLSIFMEYISVFTEIGFFGEIIYPIFPL